MQTEPSVVSHGHPTKFNQLRNMLQRQATWGSSLEGKILTFIDAAYTDKEQREAVKSILKGIIREHFNQVNNYIARDINRFTDHFENQKIDYTTTFGTNPSAFYDCQDESTLDYNMSVEDVFHDE